MARKSNPRENYRHDAIVLNRIIGAIEQDATSPEDWKATVKYHLTKAFQLLLEHESDRARHAHNKKVA